MRTRYIAPILTIPRLFRHVRLADHNWGYLLRRSFSRNIYYSGTKSFSAETLVAHRHLASFRCSDMLRVRQRCRFLAIQLRSRELSMNRSYDPRRNTTYSRDLFRFLRPHPGDSRGTT